MSGFVPIRSASTFSAGIVGGPGESQPVETPPAKAPSELSESAEVTEDSVEVILPANAEELSAMLEEARAEARNEADARLAEAHSEIEAERAVVGDLVSRIEAARSSWNAEVRSVLGELVVVGVRSVVSESADLQEEMLRDRFAEIGERLISEQGVVVRVRPNDLELACSLVGDRDGWQVISDGEISGGLVAETEGGRIDASLGSALTGIAESVQEWQNEGDE